MLGGVDIDCDRGLDGHSDADVLCHAMMDAMLGAVADGDIGVHFPDTALEWKDASSIALLKAVGDRLRGRGEKVVNLDFYNNEEGEPRPSARRTARQIMMKH